MSPVTDPPDHSLTPSISQSCISGRAVENANRSAGALFLTARMLVRMDDWVSAMAANRKPGRVAATLKIRSSSCVSLNGASVTVATGAVVATCLAGGATAGVGATDGFTASGGANPTADFSFLSGATSAGTANATAPGLGADTVVAAAADAGAGARLTAGGGLGAGAAIAVAAAAGVAGAKVAAAGFESTGAVTALVAVFWFSVGR